MYEPPLLDFERFHQSELPSRIAAADAAAFAGLAPLALRVDGRAYAYRPAAEGLRVSAGDAEAETVVDLDAAGWSGLVQEFQTVTGLAVQGRAVVSRGDLGEMLRWEPALMSLYWGVPVYDPAKADLADGAGRPLDLRRSFTLEDSEEEMRAFFGKAGYLHLRGVFAEEEVAAIRAEVRAQTLAARPGDGRSWWGRTQGGETVVTRLTYAGLASPRVAALLEDPRVRRIASLGGPGLSPVLDREEGQVVILKTPGVIEGVADYPWHQDFSMGGRPYMCPGVLIGLQLTASNPDSGPFIVVPGTQGTVCRTVLPDEDAARLPRVAIETEPGDCTVHFTDTLHAAPPPRVGGRETLYLNFAPPFLHANLAPGESHNDYIQRNLSQV